MLSNVYELVFGLVARMRREEGQTMAEYGLLLAVIAVVVVAAALVLGDSISSLFLGVASSL
jgi:pilus assembly protein Flp/PilA